MKLNIGKIVMICLFYIVKNHFLIESYKIVYRHNDKYNHHNQTTLTMQNPHSIDAPHYTTRVLDSHHTGQPTFDSHDYTSMPHHGLSPNDKQNTHWFGLVLIINFTLNVPSRRTTSYYLLITNKILKKQNLLLWLSTAEAVTTQTNRIRILTSAFAQ